MNTQGDSRSRQATAVRGKTNIGSQPDALLTVWDLVTCIHVDLVPDVFRAGIVFFKAVGKLWARRFLPKTVFPRQHRVLQPTVRELVAFRNPRRIRHF